MLSKAKKEGVDEDIAKYDGKWSVEEPTDNPLRGDVGLVLKVCLFFSILRGYRKLNYVSD